jgi:hypothetical protein
VQLLGEVWLPVLYEPFRAAHHAKLRARQIVLPAARGPFMLILWGLEAGAEATPDLRHMPLAIGTPVAISGRDDQSNHRAAFGIAVETWITLNRGHGLGPFAFAPPVLEVRTRSNGVQREVMTFGQEFPLPVADGLIPRT